MKLLRHAILTATIRLKTGLHIGTGEDVAKGEPLPVMRSLRTGLPYIPGSSLKGKTRFMLELTYGRQQTDERDKGSPCTCGGCQICTLFGSGSQKETIQPTRLIFRDAYLTKEFEDRFEEIGLEDKTGIRVDRNTGTVSKGALFNINRVPEGFEFNMEISVRVFEKDNIEAIKQWLMMGLYLVEQDTLGGGGTRGSGHIEFTNIKFDGKDFEPNWRETCKEIKDRLLDIKISQ